MKKSYLGGVVLFFVLLGVFLWYWQTQKAKVIITTETTNEVITPSVSTNPLDNKPDINPADQTNPFKNIKTNPFE